MNFWGKLIGRVDDFERTFADPADVSAQNGSSTAASPQEAPTLAGATAISAPIGPSAATAAQPALAATPVAPVTVTPATPTATQATPQAVPVAQAVPTASAASAASAAPAVEPVAMDTQTLGSLTADPYERELEGLLRAVPMDWAVCVVRTDTGEVSSLGEYLADMLATAGGMVKHLGGVVPAFQFLLERETIKLELFYVNNEGLVLSGNDEIKPDPEIKELLVENLHERIKTFCEAQVSSASKLGHDVPSTATEVFEGLGKALQSMEEKERNALLDMLAKVAQSAGGPPDGDKAP